MKRELTMIKNTTQAYGWVAITLHWVMALGVFFMFGLGLYMVELSYYDAWYKGSLDLHKSIGIVLFVLWCIRLIWRLVNLRPVLLETKTPFQRFEQVMAHCMHLALYGFLIALMFSGYLISTADGRSISVFDIFDVPAVSALVEQQEDVAGEIHYILAWCVLVMVVVHALAALKHHLQRPVMYFYL